MSENNRTRALQLGNDHCVVLVSKRQTDDLWRQKIFIMIHDTIEEHPSLYRTVILLLKIQTKANRKYKLMFITCTSAYCLCCVTKKHVNLNKKNWWLVVNKFLYVKKILNSVFFFLYENRQNFRAQWLINLEIPVLVRSLKSSNVELD